MRIELPLCTRCCFCLPLRHGLIAWGYFNLFIGCLMTTGSIIVLNRLRYIPENEEYKITPQGVWITCTVLAVGIVEIILSIIFIVGCHKKNLKFLKTFYYYNITLTGVSTALCLYSSLTTLISTVTDENLSERSLIHVVYYPLIEFGLLFADFGIQLYMLLVLRTEILKLSNDCQFRFSNIGGEAECTFTSENLNKENSQ